jgi:hypothetical protein
MKKIFLFLIFGCISLYCFTGNPKDPAIKVVEFDQTFIQLSPLMVEQSSNTEGLVEVTIYVSFNDCPGYDCEAKDCAFEICVYDYNYTLLDCQPFDPDQCDYEFEGIRATETYKPWAKLVPVYQQCNHQYNNSYIEALNAVPMGGGDVYIDTYLCQ